MEKLPFEVKFKIANFLLKLNSSNIMVVKDLIAHFSPRILDGVCLRLYTKDLKFLNSPLKKLVKCEFIFFFFKIYINFFQT